MKGGEGLFVSVMPPRWRTSTKVCAGFASGLNHAGKSLNGLSDVQNTRNHQPNHDAFLDVVALPFFKPDSPDLSPEQGSEDETNKQEGVHGQDRHIVPQINRNSGHINDQGEDGCSGSVL